MRKQTYLTEEQDRAIKRLAAAAGTSEADMLRRAVDAYLLAQGMGEAGDPYLPLVNLGTSGTGDGSVRHDEIYEHL